MTITTNLFGSETRDGRTISEGRRDASNSRDKNICTCISICVSSDWLNYIVGKDVGDTKTHSAFKHWRLICCWIIVQLHMLVSLTSFESIKLIICSNLICTYIIEKKEKEHLLLIIEVIVHSISGRRLEAKIDIDIYNSR